VTRITVVPAGPRDAVIHGSQYAELRAALNDLGYETTVEAAWGEERSAELQVVADVAIHVGEILAADALLRLARELRRYLRGLRRPANGEPRQAVIYGPKGEVLSRVDLPAESEED
jgi:hypothetical protein